MRWLLALLLLAPRVLVAQEHVDAINVPEGYEVVRLPPLEMPPLQREGYAAKRRGALLFGFGGLFLAAATLAAGFAAHDIPTCIRDQDGDSATCYQVMGGAAEVASAAVFGVAGLALISAGIVTYVRGGKKVAAASIAPYASPTGAGAQLHLSF